tara:strand:+ start:6785 stop:7972 length:1188 start_codon:yes stop_codon:yes gene_type:complete
MSNLKSYSNNNLSSLVGVVGGGQLAQMLGEAALKRDIDIAVQTPSKDDPATLLSKEIFLADENDINSTRKMAQISKTITFENEWIDIEKLIDLEKEGVNFIPSLDSLKYLVNKISQRILLKELQVPGPEWIRLSSIDLHENILPSGWRFPLMAKASIGGYDGKGTKVIRNFSDLTKFIDLVDKNLWFLEKWVDYEKEYSLVISRDILGTIRTFPLVETNQYKQVCNWVIAPANAGHQVETMAYNIAASLLTKLNYIGVLAIEFFYGSKGLLVNEIAPRTHNSAHYSIEACESSQFDQQICIAAGLPLANPKLLVPGSLMINLLGLSKDMNSSIEERIEKIRNIEGAHLHWYGKTEEKPGRKLGHVTFLLNEEDSNKRRQDALKLLEKIRLIWPIE